MGRIRICRSVRITLYNLQESRKYAKKLRGVEQKKLNYLIDAYKLLTKWI